MASASRALFRACFRNRPAQGADVWNISHFVTEHSIRRYRIKKITDVDDSSSISMASRLAVEEFNFGFSGFLCDDSIC